MLQYLPGETRIEEVSTTLMDRDEIIRQLRHHILNAQNSMSQYANKKRREVEYQVGDMVFLKIWPYRQLSLQSRVCPKLSPRFYELFLITERIGAVAYKLQLPAESRVQLVFHIYQLKKVVGNHFILLTLPPELAIEESIPILPEEILSCCSLD